ncbi:hypothetical protein [Georgenia sp. SUBG003]|uniref:hypothetical protein n=1 Tax=Georgenia sp. SUBG003 TaxID=1497974 RepID=UPI003AB7DA65
MGRFTGPLLGSVSQKVAAHAHGPVMVVREQVGKLPGPVVVGADPLDPSTEVLRFAFEEARRRDVGVTVVKGAGRRFAGGAQAPDSARLKLARQPVAGATGAGGASTSPSVAVPTGRCPGRSRQRPPGRPGSGSWSRHSSGPPGAGKGSAASPAARPRARGRRGGHPARGALRLGLVAGAGGVQHEPCCGAPGQAQVLEPGDDLLLQELGVTGERLGEGGAVLLDEQIHRACTAAHGTRSPGTVRPPTSATTPGPPSSPS